MDAAMAQHYGALHSDAGYSSLHDEFLQDIHDTVCSVYRHVQLYVLVRSVHAAASP